MTTKESVEKLRAAQRRAAGKQAQKQAALAALGTPEPRRRQRHEQLPASPCEQRPDAPPTGPPPNDGKLLLSFHDLKALGISWSREHIRRQVLAGQFPAPVPLGDPTLRSARKVWKRADVFRWLRQRGLT